MASVSVTVPSTAIPHIQQQKPKKAKPSEPSPSLTKDARSGASCLIIFCRSTGRYLWTQRAAKKDHGGEWCCSSGGGIEAGETPEQAAIRECKEETGYDGDADEYDVEPLYHKDGADLDFYIFKLDVKQEFEPECDPDEIQAYTWAARPPDPVHPGMIPALRKLGIKGAFKDADEVDSEKEQKEIHANDAWNEGDHPRGQPGNAGQFMSGSGGGGKAPVYADPDASGAKKGGELLDKIKSFLGISTFKNSDWSSWSEALPPTSAAQKKAVEVYTDATYVAINRALRNDKDAGSFQKDVDELKGWLDTCSFPEDTTVARYVQGANFFGDVKPGDVIRDKAFMSTTANIEHGLKLKTKKSTILVINVPKGSKAAYISGLSVIPSEREVLCQAGSRLKITKMKNGVIHADLLPPEEAQARPGNTPETHETQKPLKLSELKKTGGKLGSNQAGTYEDDKGNKFYVKHLKSPAHVKNELLAGNLYNLAGAETLDYVPVEGEHNLATKWTKFDKNDATDLTSEEKKAVQDNFAVHAWLANWDAAGLHKDNQAIKGGKAVSNDLGGALEYRAQGAPKGGAFGNSVGEWDTLRNKNMNPQNASLFGGMSNEQLKASANKVVAIPDEAIHKAVKDAGMPGELADKLIARKQDIAKRAGVNAQEQPAREKPKEKPKAKDATKEAPKPKPAPATATKAPEASYGVKAGLKSKAKNLGFANPVTTLDGKILYEHPNGGTLVIEPPKEGEKESSSYTFKGMNGSTISGTTGVSGKSFFDKIGKAIGHKGATDSKGSFVGGSFAGDAFNEQEHPRGQPGNAGQFTSGGGDSSSKVRSYGSGSPFKDSQFVNKGASKQHVSTLKEASKHIPKYHKAFLRDLRIMGADTLGSVMSKSQMKERDVGEGTEGGGVVQGFTTTDGKTIGVIEHYVVPGKKLFGFGKERVKMDLPPEHTLLHEVGHALDIEQGGQLTLMYHSEVKRAASDMTKQEKFDAQYFLQLPNEGFAELYAAAFAPNVKEFFGGMSRERVEDVFAKPLAALRNSSLG